MTIMCLDVDYATQNHSSTYAFHVTSILLLLVVVCYWKRQEFLARSRRKLPPGPRRWPVVGSLWHLLGKLPHHAFRDLSEKYDRSRNACHTSLTGVGYILYIGSTPSLIVSSPKIVEEIFRHHDSTFGSRPVTAASEIIGRGESITFAHGGDYWKHVRHIASRELLTRNRVNSYQGVRKAEMLELFTSMQETSSRGKPVVIRDKVFPFVSNSFGQTMLQRKR